MHLCRDRADAMRCVFVVSSSGMGATSQSPRCRYPPLTMPSTWHSLPGRKPGCYPRPLGVVPLEGGAFTRRFEISKPSFRRSSSHMPTDLLKNSDRSCSSCSSMARPPFSASTA